MPRHRVRRVFLVPLLSVSAACGSVPPPPPVVVPFETKMSWILRLEDQRVLRDEPMPIAPPPPVAENKRNALPPPPPPPDLVRLLGDAEARIRRRAAIAVGRVGLPEAVPDLVKLLQADADAEVRQMAAFALGLIGDPSAIEPLRAAVGDPLPIVAGRAAEALGLLNDAASAPVIGKMVAAHAAAAAAVAPDEARAQVNEAADAFRLGVYALARLKNYEALAGSVLGADGLPRLQWWPVAYALQRIEDKRALPALIALAGAESSYTRTFAIKGLGQLRDPSAVALLLPLIDASLASNPSTVEAIRAMARIGDARGEPVLTKLLYSRGLNPMVRAETLLALGESSGAVSVDSFIDFLGDPNPTVRRAALQAFAKRDDEFLTVLSGLDPDPHWSLRAALATILGSMDAERALPRLMPMLADSDARVVPSVLNALTKLKAPDLAKILFEHLGKEDVGIRTAAATNIGEARPEGGADQLVAAYKRGEADLVIDTRAAALEALSKYGASAAVPMLRTALGDKDWAVRVKAAELLKTLDPSIETANAIRPVPVAAGLTYEAPSLTSPAVSPHVFIETAKGAIEIELDVLDAPITAGNFMTLARKGYFDGLSFHRVVPNFVIQGGDPRGDGDGGPGYTIRDELNQEPYLRGTVGMALAWRDTGGSQFFITHSPQPHLDARYTVFGRVVSGMDVVDAIAQWDVITRIRVWDGVQDPGN